MFSFHFIWAYEAQIDYYTQYIQRNPEWKFVKVYTDEGISGTSTKHRTGFNEMIDDAMSGKMDLIVTKSVSRFARNTVDSLVTHALLDTHAQALSPLPQYACLLGFKRECSSLLRSAKSLSLLPRLKPQDQLPEQLLDARAWDLWALGAGQPFGALYRCQPVIL